MTSTISTKSNENRVTFRATEDDKHNINRIHEHLAKKDRWVDRSRIMRFALMLAAEQVGRVEAITKDAR